MRHNTPLLLHCWHLSGRGTEGSTGGSEEIICCDCGKESIAMYRYETEPIEGHGPFSKERTKRYTYPRDADCPGRKQ